LASTRDERWGAGPVSTPTPESLIRQALIFRHAGENAKAIDLLKEALAAEPNHLNAQIQLGATYLDLGKTGPALEALKGAASQAPNSEIVRRLQALGHLQRGDLVRALADAYEAVRLDPSDGVTQTILGRVLDRKRDWAGAEAALRRGAELAPESDYALVHLGYFLIRRRKFKEAALVAEDAARAAPDDFGVILLRGDVALRLGKAEEAKDFALWALSQKASHREAIRLLVSVKAHQSWWLGLWWRLNSNIWLRLLLVIATLPLGVWFVAPLYLIAGRLIFEHMLARELKTVKLKRGF
jgi:tetratricopeptide (TPR) repeat protein